MKGVRKVKRNKGERDLSVKNKGEAQGERLNQRADPRL